MSRIWRLMALSRYSSGLMGGRSRFSALRLPVVTPPSAETHLGQPRLPTIPHDRLAALTPDEGYGRRPRPGAASQTEAPACRVVLRGMLRNLASTRQRNQARTARALAGPRKIALHPRAGGSANFGPFPLARPSHFGRVATIGVARQGPVRTGQKGAHHERGDREKRRGGHGDRDGHRVGGEPPSIPSCRARRCRLHLHLRHLHAGRRVALWLGMGTWTLSLPDDDPRRLRNARRLSPDRVQESGGSHEPDLVHGLVERRPRRHHGRSGRDRRRGARAPDRGRAGAFGCGDRAGGLDAARQESMRIGEGPWSKLPLVTGRPTRPALNSFETCLKISEPRLADREGLAEEGIMAA